MRTLLQFRSIWCVPLYLLPSSLFTAKVINNCNKHFTSILNLIIEQEHDEKKCGIYIAGKIFSNTVCKKLSNLLIFATNFTTCPPASVNQLFVEGVRNIPKLECIEFIGCVSRILILYFFSHCFKKLASIISYFFFF